MSDEPETHADAIASDLGHACGRKLVIDDVREYIDDQGLTNLEKFELACALLEELNYVAPKPWTRESSQEIER